MYTYIRALTKKSGINTAWEHVNISVMSPYEIFGTFSKCYVQLSHPMLSSYVTLDLDDVKNDILNVSVPFNAWLVALANRTLPTTDSFPSVYTASVKYKDVVNAGYRIRAVDRSAHPDADIAPGSCSDLLLSAPGVDYTMMYENVLVTVNGYYHRTSGTVHGLQVIDGAETSRHGNGNTCGITSFAGLGGIEIVDIDSSMTFEHNSDHVGESSLHRVHMKSPVDLTSKSVILVLGGYMHVLSDVYWVTSDNTFTINFDKLSLVHLYLQMRKTLPLEGWDVAIRSGESDAFHQPDVDCIAGVNYLLNMSQTFMVLVDNVSLDVTKKYLVHSQLPGRYVSHYLPELPMIGWLGKTLDYLTFNEGDRWSIRCESNFQHNLKLDTMNLVDHDVVDDTDVPYVPAIMHDAYLLDISGEMLTFD